MDAAATAALAVRPAGVPFEEDPPRRSPEERGAAPLLRLDAFEGRLDWLLELARGHRVDLARLSLVEIADQLLLALDEAAREQHGGDRGGASLPRRSGWVVMGATLAELRSRLLLPEDSAVGRQARQDATALRDQLVERERVLAAAGWLDARPQLGRDVFARGGGAAGVNSTVRARSTDLTALLRACLAALQAEVARERRYRPEPLPLWRVPDAIARITRLLPQLRESSTPENAALWRFLPHVAPEPPDYDLRCRSAVASTLVAGLELAREGHLTLEQEERFGTVAVHAVEDAVSVEAAMSAVQGDSVAGSAEKVGS